MSSVRSFVRESLDRQLRREATVLDTVIFDQAVCVYCGSPVKWCYTAAGDTRHLDHFVPVEIIVRARQHWPQQKFANWLLPCCPTCNNILNVTYFATLCDRADFVRWKLRLRGTAIRSPETSELASLNVPKELQSLVRPMSEFRYGRDDIILAPVRLANGDWSTDQRLAERALIGCSSPITSSEQLKTGFTFSQAL
jgi:hypothetical protein